MTDNRDNKKLREVVGRIACGDLPVDYDWNLHILDSDSLPSSLNVLEPTPSQARHTTLVSEDLRDGLHGISIYPRLVDMVEYIGKLSGLGINHATVGIYSGNHDNKLDRTMKELLRIMESDFPHMNPIVLSLATEESLNWLADCKSLNDNLSSLIFMGTAPSRLLVEEWDRNMILDRLGYAINKATNEYGIKIVGATEHTTQTPPDFLKEIINVQVENGADYFCIADTIGTARPIGTYNIVRFVRSHLEKIGRGDVRIDWHGHDDMGNGVSNALIALGAGANRLHVVARGIGERAGNTSMEGILLNLSNILESNGVENPWNINYLTDVLKNYDKLANLNDNSRGPLGDRSHTTSLGIHTAAMLKATNLAKYAKNNDDMVLAESLYKMSRKIYSSVDPEMYGKEHDIRVGHWSGKSSVIMAYEISGGNPDNLSDETINKVLHIAKNLERELSCDELKKIIDGNT